MAAVWDVSSLPGFDSQEASISGSHGTVAVLWQVIPTRHCTDSRLRHTPPSISGKEASLFILDFQSEEQSSDLVTLCGM